MKTDLLEHFAATDAGREAESILRSCVHCGFCNATCPTYQLLGDELDGPRGRIYQIKQLLEGGDTSAATRGHLDRCLTCRACETTCPSGVQYGRLLDIGRDIVEKQQPRGWDERLQRWLLRKILPSVSAFGFLLRVGRMFRPLVPEPLQSKIPKRRAMGEIPWEVHARRVLLFDGCVQKAATPDTNAALSRVLGRLGITVMPLSGCCGAASYHLSATEEGLGFARRNIDRWWPSVEQGCEALISSASGCGVMVKDYGELLSGDAAYAEKARRISALTRDVAEFVAGLDLGALDVSGEGRRVVFHPPCTLQHGQKITGVVENILRSLNFELLPVTDNHLCCGSAGTYSVLQPALATQLRDRKLANLESGQPEMIVTANVGCELHLESAAGVPVRHWLQLLDEQTAGLG